MDDHPPSAPELLVIVPVYNEQASIRKVLHEWFHEIENWTENFEILVIDDGSTDATLTAVQRMQATLGPRLKLHSRANRGHGQTCIEGYQIACDRGIPFVFQLDSDGQCDPQYFFRFWRVRHQFDVVYGRRFRRDDGWRRVIASFVVKLTLAAVARVHCVDANVPYRLMRTDVLRDLLPKIPPDFSLANVGLAVLLRRKKNVRHGYVPIRFRERYGGEPSVRFGKFGAKAKELVENLRSLPPV